MPTDRTISRYDPPAPFRGLGLARGCIPMLVAMPVKLAVYAAAALACVLLFSRGAWQIVAFALVLPPTVLLLNWLERLEDRAADRKLREIYAQAQQRKFAVCPECLHPLDADAGACAKCGVRYTMDAVRASWSQCEFVGKPDT